MRALARTYVTPRVAWIHCTAIFIPSVKYPLALCHLSDSKLNELQWPYIHQLLRKMGMSRKTPAYLRHGPREYGGIAIPDLRLESKIDQLELIIRTLRTPGTLQQLIIVHLNTLQHNSGLSKPLFQYPEQRAPHLEGHFYPHFRKSMAAINLPLTIPSITIPALEREKDC